MNFQEILRRSRALAQASLTASLAELAHEARNGLDRERIARFANLAAEADALLSAPIREPKAPEPKTQVPKVRKARKAREPKVPEPKPLLLTRPQRILNILRVRRDQWISTAELASILEIPPGWISGTITRVKQLASEGKDEIESERGKGYRLMRA
jgi:biotin operon repressor